jgi:uncharacterized iron-regulated membrane protein
MASTGLSSRENAGEQDTQPTRHCEEQRDAAIHRPSFLVFNPRNIPMKEHFRQSMAWWHTWVGLICGWLLFAIFFTGTAAVFRNAGLHWLQPELHLPAATSRMNEQGMVEAAERVLRTQGEGPEMWSVNLPAHSAAHFEAGWWKDGWQGIPLDAATGEPLAAQPRKSRAMFLLRWFHYSLYGLPGPLGHWLVGAMAMAMLALLVTGVIVHKRIFTDFFTFRPRKAPARSWLDAHNVSSVMTLPFALMITYSGLAIFWLAWMPAGQAMVGREAMRDETRPALQYPNSPGNPAPTLPLWSFVKRAQSGLVEGQTLQHIFVFEPGGKETQVRVSHGNDAMLWGGGDEKIFNGATGELLGHETDSASAARATQGVLRVMHEIHFAGPVLRWLYFLMSAGCCVMIATGLVLWTIKRRHRILKQGTTTASAIWGWRVVEALNVGTVAGLLIATAAMFWSNRLIPADLPGRVEWEIQVFFVVWGLCGLCALWRAQRLSVSEATAPGATQDASTAKAVGPRRLWAEQLFFAAGLYGLIPLVNAIMTPTSALWVTIPSGQTTVAGFDLTMLGSGLLLALTARRVLVGRRSATANKRAAAVKENAADEDEAENPADAGDAENTGRAVA